VKQWQKLIQPRLEHTFHAVTRSEETGSEILAAETLSRALMKLNVKPEKAAFVVAVSSEVVVANRSKIINDQNENRNEPRKYSRET